MLLTTTYPYIFQPYQGRSTRYACPACRKTHCFTRYLNTATGELLDSAYGRCDHEINCGYHRSPYRDKLPKQLPTSSHHGKGHALRPSSGVNQSTWFIPPKVVHTIPAAILESTVQPSHYRVNALAMLLRKYFGLGDADELLQRFQLGTSAYWPGACIFWLIDEQGRVRGGQVVLYDETGHTVTTDYRHTRWVHTALTQHYKCLGMPVPVWLANYKAYGQKSPCLFGLPQLTTASAGQPVALVESAKTAMLATYYMPNFVWLATMGLSNLTEERLRPLKGRKIVLYPDAGAFDNWSLKAADLRRLGYQMEVSDLLEKNVTPAEHRAGIDIADILMREYPGYPPNWDTK
jgi:hypothetical protein